jgi:hypothetical protein
LLGFGVATQRQRWHVDPSEAAPAAVQEPCALMLRTPARLARLERDSYRRTLAVPLK